MASASKTPTMSGVVSPFLSAVSFGEDDDYYEGKQQLCPYPKSKSLNNITSLEKSSSGCERTTIPVQDEQVLSSNGHQQIENGNRDSYTLQPANERESNFSPQNSLEAIAHFKQGHILKETPTYSSVRDGGWQGQKRPRINIDLGIDRKDLMINETESHIKRTEQYFNSAASSENQQRINSIRNNITMSQTFHLPLQRIPGELSTMHNKAYDVIAPHSHATDVENASVNMRAASVTHNAQTVKWDAHHSEQLSGKFYNGKKYQEQCVSGKLSEAKQLCDRAIVAMNATSLSAVPATATDLSQHSISNSGNVLHREESISNKVYPHLFLSSQSLDQRQRECQDQLMKGSREEFILHNQVDAKDIKKFNINNFKQTVWSGFAPTTIFAEQQQQVMPHQQLHYEPSLYPDANPTGIHHPPPRHFDSNPILLKDPNALVKHEGAPGHGSIPITWDKTTTPFDRMVGSIYKQDSRPCYLKPPPVDLDDLSEDERERMRLKRERNRVAAAKCRNRRRELLERLEKEAEQLEREQEVLRESVKKLQAQKRKLGSMLDKHEPTCVNKVEQNAGKSFSEEKSQEQPAE